MNTALSPNKANGVMTEQAQAKPVKSILYTVDATGSNEYVHTNNFVPGAKPKRADDMMSQASKTQRQSGAIQKSFLDDSKVNKNVARDLMSTRPIFSVQEIQGGQA
jgi:hypothetical protein